MQYIYIVSGGIKTTPFVNGIGFTKDPKCSSSYGPGQRKDYTIHFNIKGKGYFNSNPVEEGQGFLVYDGMYAHHYADKDNPWHLLWITISGDSAEDVLKKYNADPETNIFDYTSPLTVKELASEIQNSKEFCVDSLKLMEMFLKVHCTCIKSENDYETENSSKVYIDYATKYISDNIHRPITVGELTKLIGVSQAYLYKIFSGVFGISPKQYIIDSKLKVAKSMLKETDMTVTEIAYSIGYPDVLTFSRVFKSKEMISPQNYRTKHRLSKRISK